MGHNVQSQAGVSLSDIYDIKGGQAPIERLVTTEVPVVHEMGGTIFSERVSGTIRRRSITIAQNITIDEILDNLPSGVYMLHGVSVITDTPTRINELAVLARDPFGLREIPVWVWDGAGVTSTNIRMQDDGAAVTTFELLTPLPDFTSFPVLMIGEDQPQQVSAIAMRGNSLGFGAGTVTITLLLRISFAAIGGISARGLPIPSW